MIASVGVIVRNGLETKGGGVWLGWTVGVAVSVAVGVGESAGAGVKAGAPVGVGTTGAVLRQPETRNNRLNRNMLRFIRISSQKRLREWVCSRSQKRSNHSHQL